MSPIFAAVLALVAPYRRGPDPGAHPARLETDRLSAHLRRDIGLADGRERRERDGGRER
jgi:hypothetical protein